MSTKPNEDELTEESIDDITKICLYNFDLHKPHFYIVKLGFKEVYIIFLIFARKHRDSAHNLCFEQKYEKYQSFLSENFQFLEVKFSINLSRRVYVISTSWPKNEYELIKMKANWLKYDLSMN